MVTDDVGEREKQNSGHPSAIDASAIQEGADALQSRRSVGIPPGQSGLDGLNQRFGHFATVTHALSMQHQVECIGIPGMEQLNGLTDRRADAVRNPHAFHNNIDMANEPLACEALLDGQLLLKLQRDELSDQIAGQPQWPMRITRLAMMTDDHAPELPCDDQRHRESRAYPHVFQTLDMDERNAAKHDIAQIQRIADIITHSK